MIPTLHNKAHIHLQNREVPQALECFAEALNLAVETNRPYDVFDELLALGNLLCRLGEKDRGLELLRQALDAGQQIGHPDLPQVQALLRELAGE